MATHAPPLERPLGESLDRRRKTLVLASLMLAMFIAAIDQTVVTTAAPKIVADLGGFHLLSWIFTSYLLSSTIAVALVGKLSDMFGRRIFLTSGIIIFTIASAGCGVAPSMPALIVARGLQGIGGGFLIASTFATLGDLFPPAERSKYAGLFTGVFTLSNLLGPTVGGLLTDNAGWRWIFYLNVPFALVAAPAIWRNLPHGGARSRRRIDVLGALALCAWTVPLLLALTWTGEEYGWRSLQSLALLGAFALFLVLFVIQETRHPEPILPLRLFANRTLLVWTILMFVVGAGLFTTGIYLPTFVQTSLGKSATTSGLLTTPQSLALLAMSVIGGQMIARTGRYRWLTIVGASLLLTATGLLTTLGRGSPLWHVSVFLTVMGFGFGLLMPVSQVVVQNAVPHELLGVSTSVRQFFLQMGQVLGTAVFGVLLATSYTSVFHDEIPPDARRAIPAQTLARFDDPTITLDANAYAAVRDEVRALPDGDLELSRVLSAQRHAVAVTVHRLLQIAVLFAALAWVLVVIARELPLRRSFESTARPMPPE